MATRRTNTGNENGFNWIQEAEDAVIALGKKEVDSVTILVIDAKENVTLHSTKDIGVDALSSTLPNDQASYTVFSWARPKREIVYIFSCPEGVSIKQRMVLSTGAYGTFIAVKNILESSSAQFQVASKRIEITELSELDEAFLKEKLRAE